MADQGAFVNPEAASNLPKQVNLSANKCWQSLENMNPGVGLVMEWGVKIAYKLSLATIVS